MTYAELWVFVDQLRAQLPPRAITVLSHLIARCIAEGSNEIELSISKLASNLGMSRDPVHDAAIRLEGIIEVRAAAGVSMRWTLPADWFEPQRSLFTVSTAVEKYRNLPRNQAGTPLETRQAPREKPGRYLTRNQAGMPENQAGVPGNQAGPAWKPGGSPLETRQVPTQNQQLTADYDRSDQIRSDFSGDISISVIQESLKHTAIPIELTREAEIVSQSLCDWCAHHQVPPPTLAGPPASMLAPLLALAPTTAILKALGAIRSPRSGPPRKWAWFFVTLANQILGLDAKVICEVIEQHRQKTPPRRTVDRDFGRSLINQVAAGRHPVL